ncbi:MAG: hypothetical protein IAE83_09535 [Anaerolinea sp.]|nr:hypothetical protein [Anaerolinea sp.]
MSLTLTLALMLISALYWIALPPGHRRTMLLLTSLILLYALQPPQGYPPLAFVFPTTLVIMTLGVGWLAHPESRQGFGQGLAVTVMGLFLVFFAPNAQVLIRPGAAFLEQGMNGALGTVISATVLIGVSGSLVGRSLPRWSLIGLTAALILIVIVGRGALANPLSLSELGEILLMSLPSGVLGWSLIGLIILSFAPFGIAAIQSFNARKRLALIWLGLMVGFQVLIKAQGVNHAAAEALSGSRFDLGWFALSYISFRLAHVLLDLRDESLEQPYSLSEFVIFTLFFPTLSAGPVTRLEEIVPQLRQNPPYQPAFSLIGGLRVLAGMVKTFVISNVLGIAVLQPALAHHQGSVPALWVMLYATMFRFYFDFSGYSDIAIGLGQMYGITLPENFKRPFVQPNLSLFWQSWHVSLSTWFRQYWFNPLVRTLMGTPIRKRQNWIVFFAQISTMGLIGLWHQIAPNWLIWGLWHGVGLWAYKLISDRTRKWHSKEIKQPGRARLIRALSVLVTVNYVALSFAFVALPDAGTALRYLVALFGVRL